MGRAAFWLVLSRRRLILDIQINSKGLRFGNELGRRDYLTQRILKECSPVKDFQGGSGGRPAAFMLMNDAAADSFGRPAFNFYHVVKKFFGVSATLQLIPYV